MAAGGAGDRRVPGYLGRVLDGGVPVGTCFQVAPGVLVTAWHVLDGIGAADEGARVGVDPLAGGEPFSAAVVRMDSLRDLVVLTCVSGLPAVAGPLAVTDQLPLRALVHVTGHAVPWKAPPFPDCGNGILLSRYLRFQELIADLLRRPVPVR